MVSKLSVPSSDQLFRDYREGTTTRVNTKLELLLFDRFVCVTILCYRSKFINGRWPISPHRKYQEMVVLVHGD